MTSAYAHVQDGADPAIAGLDSRRILREYSTPAQKTRDRGTALISSSIMLGYEGLVALLGGDPAALMRSVGLDPALGGNPFEQVDFATWAMLLERTAQALDRPDFGMRLGKLQSGFVVMGLLTFELLASRTPFRRQIMEQLLLIGNNAAIDLSSGRTRAKEIWFSHAPLAPPAAYREAFGARVVFCEARNAAIFDSADVDARVRTRDRELLEAMLEALSCHMAAGSSLSAQVKREVIRWIHDEAGTERDAVARRLGIHPRTLQRRLSDEGHSFELIKDQVRRELAQHYLIQSPIPLTEVSARLGFAEPAVLTRACRRWFACTPRDMRRAAC